MKSLTVVLPMPPSTNRLFSTIDRNKRVRSRVYRDWSTEAGWALKQQSRASFAGDVELVMRFGPRDRRSDVTNRIKAAEDLLVEHGILADDRYVVRCVVEWADDVRGCEITITDRSA
jgi:Holliday junction resolvase RusA-like endonuclease